MDEKKLEADQVELERSKTEQVDDDQVNGEQSLSKEVLEEQSEAHEEGSAVEQHEDNEGELSSPQEEDLFAVDEDWPTLSFVDPKETSLIISADDHETRIAFLHEHVPTELFFDRSQDLTLVGNIYKGRVVRVLPGMQAAFVDIGLKQAAFLYVDDIADEKGRHITKTNNTRLSTTMMESSFTQTIDVDTGRSIQQLLQEGQELMVQVSKDPISTKGARVTNHISIAGRYLVYIPLVEHIGVSRRITNEEERERLKEILSELIPQGGGFVARTVAEGCSLHDLRKDLNYLRQVWNEVLTRLESMTAPANLYQDLNLTLKTTRDLITPNLSEIVVDHQAVHDELKLFIERFMPEYISKLRLYEGLEPLYESYGIEAELNRALSRQVWLPSGGYLVIDQTEAFTAIDVNSGRFVGKMHFEETIYRTNIEAVHEVVHQLQLRNLGGIIILDLIDMENSSMSHKVHTAFVDALKRDRAKTNVSKISKFGLIEMTRTRIRDSLLRSICDPCFYCQGTGFLKSTKTITYNIYREIMQEESKHGQQIIIEAHPSVVQYFEEDGQVLTTDLENQLDLRVRFHPNATLHIERYRYYFS